MIKDRTPQLLIAVLLIVCFCGCDKDNNNEPPLQAEPQIPVIHEETEKKEAVSDQRDPVAQKDENAKTPAEPEQKTLTFRDVFGQEYQTEIDPRIVPNPYDGDRFVRDGDKLQYDDDGYDCITGIDVSHHQGSVDWKSVKDQGYDFVFLRIGYRGYGKKGSLNRDRTFDQNYENARAAGLLTGVYFFAQAVNEEEAVQEAEFVLKILNNRELELPVVYDPESILDDEARTDSVTGEQFTKNSRAFCDAVKAAGYKPMIYSNMLWEAFQLDLYELSDIPIWYADYEDVPQTPYNFEFWQYSNEGRVHGVSGVADLDIWMRQKED